MDTKKNTFIKNKHIKSSVFLKELSVFIRNHEKMDENKYYKFGYETFGIVLYGFCEWMIENLKKNNTKKILFFSRDGHILKRAFELFCEAKEFDYQYIYVSRRSLRVPQLHFEEYSRKQTIIPTRFISLTDLLYSVGLDIKDYANEVKQLGLCESTVYSGEEVDKGKVKKMLDLFWNDIIENSQKEYYAAKRYIDNLGLHGKVAVVDIGWRGSMQFFLQRIIDSYAKDVSLIGYYITLSSDMIHNQEMHGFLGDVDNNGTGCDRLRGYIGLIELLFSLDDGSTEKYVLEKNEVKVIKHKCEYKEDDNEIKYIKDIQRGALDFVRDFIKENGQKLVKVEFEDAFAFLDDFATNPSMDNVKMFDFFSFQNNGTITNLIECKPLFYYLLHPRRLKNDLYVSRWRIGFLKKLFRIKLPYKAIFSGLMYIAKRNG